MEPKRLTLAVLLALALAAGRGPARGASRPGIFVETPAGPKPIAAQPTAITAFVGRAERGPLNEPVPVRSFAEFQRLFGGFTADAPLAYAVNDFFLNGGKDALVVRLFRPAGVPAGRPPRVGALAAGTGGSEGQPLDAAAWLGSRKARTGLYALEKAERFNLLCLPSGASGDTPPAVYQAALRYCAERHAFLLVDPPAAWSAGKSAPAAASEAREHLADLGLTGPEARNAALYFPRLRETDPVDGQVKTFVPCGAVAGVYARTDLRRGVWKAPAGTEAALAGIAGLEVELSGADQDGLNGMGIDCLRRLPAVGPVVWGARTLAGAGDAEYRYVPVRRLALLLEESIGRGLEWAAFEPDAPALWAQIRANGEGFLLTLWRAGAFQGTRPDQAYFVKCDATTTTADDIQRGVANLLVGFAPLKPAEFIVLRFQVACGQGARQPDRK